MKSFNDSKGRKWELSLNLGSVMTIKDKMDVDLLQPESGDPPLTARLSGDPMLLASIISILIEDQFAKYNCDEKSVYESFDGATLFSATEAFYEEMIAFFQQLGRHHVSMAIQKQLRMVKAGVAAAEKRIEAIDEQKYLNEMMKSWDEAEKNMTSINISGSLPE